MLIKSILSSLICLFFILLPHSVQASQRDFLSPEEREWITQMDGKIQVAPDPYFPPMEYFDEQDRLMGISADYLRIIEHKLDINFEIIRLANFEQVLAKAKDRDIDMANTVIKTPERILFLSFTKPYIEIPNVIVVQDSMTSTLTIEDLRGMPHVVYQGGYTIGDHLRENHGLYHLRPINDPAQALMDLSTGQIQAMVGNLGVISFYINQLNLPNLRIAGDCKYNDVLSFASRNDWPILNTILDKVLDEISPEEKQAIQRKWIGLNLPRFHEYPEFRQGLIVLVSFFLLVIGLLYAWNRTLKKQVALRVTDHKKAREELAEEVFLRSILVEQSKDGIVVLNENGGIHEANQQFAGMLGYRMDEIKNLHVWDWDGQWSKEKLLEMIRNVGPSGDHFETRFRCKDGGMIDVEISTNGAEIKGKKYVFCVCRDITRRKEYEQEISLKNKQLQDALAQRDKFFYVIAHDLKSPISGLLSLARYFSSEIKDLTSKELNEFSNQLLNSTQNIHKLLDDLLESECVNESETHV